MPRFFDPANQSKRLATQITIYGNVLTLTGTSGTANITINGVLNTLIATFATDLTTTANNWVAGNFDFYRTRGFLVSAAAGVITVVPAWAWDSVNRINVTIVNATTNLAGTLTGTFEADFSKAKTWQVTFGQNIAVRKPRNMVEGDRIRLELRATGAYTTTFAIDGFFFPGGTENVQTSTSIDTVTGTVNVSMFPRADRITLTGTSGTANITVAGLTKLATFNTSLTQTATDFVTSHAATYALIGITVTAASGVLTFTTTTRTAANIYGTPTIVNATTNLAGTIVFVPEGRVLVDAAAKDIKQ